MGRHCKQVSLYKQVITYKPTNMGFFNPVATENCEDDKWLKVVLEQFAIPLSQGRYDDVDPNQLATSLVVYFNSRKNKCISYELALHIVIASVGSKKLFYDTLMLTDDNNKYKSKIGEMASQIFNLQQEIDKLMGRLQNLGGFQAEAAASVKSYNILNFIVKINPLMAWYYYLYGYNITGSVDPDKLVHVRSLVLSYGVEVDPITGLSGAAAKLQQRIAKDEEFAST